MTEEEKQSIKEELKKYHWYQQIELAPGIVTPGVQATLWAIPHFRIPQDLEGRSVLDLGAWNGAWSFECERRGAARVVAVDILEDEITGFEFSKRVLNSRVQYLHCSIYGLRPEHVGRFDLVLCIGLIYHLRHPLHALDLIWELCNPGALLIVESQVCDRAFVLSRETPRYEIRELPEPLRGERFAQFYAGDELAGDPSNWFSPTEACLAGWLKSSGFEPELILSGGARAVFHGKRLPDRSQWVRQERLGN